MGKTIKKPAEPDDESEKSAAPAEPDTDADADDDLGLGDDEGADASAAATTEPDAKPPVKPAAKKGAKMAPKKAPAPDRSMGWDPTRSDKAQLLLMISGALEYQLPLRVELKNERDLRCVMLGIHTVICVAVVGTQIASIEEVGEKMPTVEAMTDMVIELGKEMGEVSLGPVFRAVVRDFVINDGAKIRAIWEKVKTA